MTNEKRKAWYEKWQKSDTYKKLRAKQRELRREQQRYSFALNDDGTFRIEDVTGGEYQLNVRVREPREGRGCGLGDVIASIERTVDVPEAPGGRTDEPLQLGELPLNVQNDLSVGDPAPDFKVETLAGKTFSLSEQSGKYVLLDFWATWCGPCREETEHLKKVFERFGGRDDFVMVGLSLDRKKKDITKYVEANNVGWIQCFIDEKRRNKVKGAYGVRGIPSIWLIGPDGKVREKELRGQKIIEAVQTALPGQNRAIGE